MPSYCGDCGTAVASPAKFCSGCGVAIEGPSNSIRSDGDIHGGAYQANRDITINHAPPTEGTPAPGLSVRTRRVTPLSERVLTWANLIIGLATLFPLWQVLESVAGTVGSLLTPGGDSAGVPEISFGWVYTFMGLVALFAISINLRRVARKQTLHLSSVSWLPALAGWGGRIQFVTLDGRCTECSGRLRLSNVAVEWRLDSNGKRHVSKREPRAICSIEPEYHWWRVPASLRLIRSEASS